MGTGHVQIVSDYRRRLHYENLRIAYRFEDTEIFTRHPTWSFSNRHD
ncbi:hypothetical protein NJ7G_2572 [Natrinema sp. J7-2]|nr:hypothetical protein NJ7G_2572 [Natrinema sp. J7-2]